MLTALLDTCVLWPSLQRDFLLSLAVEGVYRPVWSSDIIEELEVEEAEKLISRGSEPLEAARRAQHLIAQMRKTFNDSEIEGWENLVGSYGLPDSNDEHVLAAAIVADAKVIVTRNIKDFPDSVVPEQIQVLLPNRFVDDIVATNPGLGFAAVEKIAARSGIQGRHRSVSDVLDKLEEVYQMKRAADLIRLWAER